MPNNTPSGAKSITKVPNQKVARRPKCCCCSSSSSDGLVQICVSFTMVFAQKKQHFSLSSAPAHRYFPGLKSRGAIRTAHWRTMASFTTPFFLHMYACTQIT